MKSNLLVVNLCMMFSQDALMQQETHYVDETETDNKYQGKFVVSKPLQLLYSLGIIRVTIF